MSSRRSPLLPLNLFMLLFALSAVTGVWPAYDPSLSTGALVTILFGIALYFALAYLARSATAIRAAAVASLIVAVAFGLYFILQCGHQDYPEKGGIIARLGKLTTLLPDLGGFSPFPNAAATFLEVAVPLGIALTLSSRIRSSRIALAVGALIVAYAVFLTASRGSWLALAATGGIAVALVLLARLPRRAATVVIGIGLVAIVVAFVAIVVLGPDRLPFLSSTFSRATDRGRLYQNSLYLAGDYAFTGAGLGDIFPMVYSRYGLLLQVPFLSYAHNLPLSVWLNQGLLGAIALAALIVTFYVFVYRVGRSGRATAVFHGAWLGVTATLLHGLTDAPQYATGDRWTTPMMFVGMGLAAASGRLALCVMASPEGRDARSIPRVVWVAVPAAVVALVVIIHGPLLARWHTNLGAIAETRAELAEGLTRHQRQDGFAAAIAEYQAALAIDPAQSNANRRLGNLLANLDRFDEAAPLLETAWEKESDNPAAIKGLGLAYTWVGRAQDAAQLFLRLDDPASMSSELYTWANYRLEQNRPLLAAYAFEAAQAMYPASTDLDVWLAIAEAYHAAEQLDAARTWYNRVLEVEPDNERARNALAEIGR
jgi:O-antigen ligase/Flp pilus assembly protein TadD